MTFKKINLILLTTLVSLFMFTGQAAAQTTIVLGTTTCDVTNPIGGAWSWDSGTNTCTFTSTDDISILAGTTLDIPAGVTLILLGRAGENSGAIGNWGALINNGTLILDGGAGRESGKITNQPGGTLTNNGTIELTGGTGAISGQLLNATHGTLNNNGIINANGGPGGRSGMLWNYGLINNACAAELNGAVVNIGTINQAPCSPEDQIADLIEAVEALGLAANPEKQLLKKLNDAADKLAAGKTGAAVDKMNGFMAQVNDLVADGRLDQATADDLGAKAQAVIEAINAG